MMVHSIVPHTHSGESHDKPHSHDLPVVHHDHHHSAGDHHHSHGTLHDQEHKDENGPKAHFAHAPDFGKFLLKPSFSPEDLKIEYKGQPICLYTSHVLPFFETSAKENWVLQKPPPLHPHYSFSIFRRGPPSIAI